MFGINMTLNYALKNKRKYEQCIQYVSDKGMRIKYFSYCQKHYPQKKNDFSFSNDFHSKNKISAVWKHKKLLSNGLMCWISKSKWIVFGWLKYISNTAWVCVCVSVRTSMCVLALYDAVEVPAFNPRRLKVFKQKFAILIRFAVHCSVKLFRFTFYI